MEEKKATLKQSKKLELQARKAIFTNDKNEDIEYNQYFVVVGDIEIPLCVPKSQGQIAKNLIKGCFEN